MTFRHGLERDVVVVACAASAGIHGALVPSHLAESTGAGLGFVAATALLAGIAIGLTLGAGTAALLGAAAVLAGLLASYGLAATTGVPVLHPEPEPIDALALATKAVEGLGLVVAAHLLAASNRRPKGTTTWIPVPSDRSHSR
jgi:hypothetical protein